MQRLRLAQDPDTPPLAHRIFNFLVHKLVVKRYSEGSRYPNRMKYEEKVKCLMRAFGHNYKNELPLRIPEKFNRQQQLQFFGHPEVQEHFLRVIGRTLKAKEQENEARKAEMKECIEAALALCVKEPKKALQVFEHRIKRKQLPWTDNMFRDMTEFSHHLYYRCMDELAQGQSGHEEEEGRGREE